MLGTGEFVSNFLTTMGFELSFLPAVIFVVSGFIGFAMGTSWGTAALILPIVLGVFPESDPLFLVTIGATLAGAVYGDHISPISDTTILSSAGAECNHLRHVATQLPYASLVAVICLFGYLLAGFTVRLGLRLSAVSLLPSWLLLQHACSATRKPHRHIASKRTIRESFGTPFLLLEYSQDRSMRTHHLRPRAMHPNKACRHITSLF